MINFAAKSNNESDVDIIESQVACETTINVLHIQIFHIQVK